MKNTTFDKGLSYQCSKCGTTLYYHESETTAVCPACGSVNEKKKPITLDYFTYGGDGSRKRIRDTFAVPEVAALNAEDLILPNIISPDFEHKNFAQNRNFAEKAAIADDKIAKILSDRFSDEERERDAKALEKIDSGNVYSEFFLNFKKRNTKKYICVFAREDAVNVNFANFALDYVLSDEVTYDLHSSVTLLDFIKDCTFYTLKERLALLRKLETRLDLSVFDLPDAFSYAHRLITFTDDKALNFKLSKAFLTKTNYISSNQIAEALLFFDTYAVKFTNADAESFLNDISYSRLSAIEFEKLFRFLISTGRITPAFASDILLRYLKNAKLSNTSYGKTTTSRLLLFSNQFAEREETFVSAAKILSELYVPKSEKSLIEVVSIIFSENLSENRSNAAFDFFRNFEPESTQYIISLLQIVGESNYPDKFHVFDFYIRNIVYLKEYNEILQFLFFIKASPVGSFAEKDLWYSIIFEERMKNCAIEKLYVLLELYNIFQSEVLKFKFSFETIVNLYRNDPVYFNKKQLALWREEMKISEAQYLTSLLAMKKFIRYAFKNQSQIEASLKELDEEIETIPPFPDDVEKKFKKQLRWLRGKPCLDETLANERTEPYLFELFAAKQVKYTGKSDAKRAVKKHESNVKNAKRNNLAGWLVLVLTSAPAIAAIYAFVFLKAEIIGFFSPIMIVTFTVFIGLIPISGAAVSFYFFRFAGKKRYFIQWFLRFMLFLAVVFFLAYSCYEFLQDACSIYNETVPFLFRLNT